MGSETIVIESLKWTSAEAENNRLIRASRRCGVMLLVGWGTGRRAGVE